MWGVFGGIRGQFGGIWGIHGRWNHYVFHSELGTTDPYYNIKKKKTHSDLEIPLARRWLPSADLLEFYA